MPISNTRQFGIDLHNRYPNISDLPADYGIGGQVSYHEKVRQIFKKELEGIKIVHKKQQWARRIFNVSGSWFTGLAQKCLTLELEGSEFHKGIEYLDKVYCFQIRVTLKAYWEFEEGVKLCLPRLKPSEEEVAQYLTSAIREARDYGMRWYKGEFNKISEQK